MDVAVYNERVMGPAHVENVAALACRTALAYRGVAHIYHPGRFPGGDRASRTLAAQRAAPRVGHTGAGVRACRIAATCRRAADVLNTGKKIAILAGRRGARARGELLEQTAEKLGAPIVKALLGKAAVPDDSPYTTGGIGLLGTEPSQDALEDCDTLLIVGSSFPYIEYLPKPGQAAASRSISIPRASGCAIRSRSGLVGDSRRAA